MNKLKTIIENFNQSRFAKKEYKKYKDHQFLNEYLEYFFPMDINEADLEKLHVNDQKKKTSVFSNKYYTEEYLPSHIRDDKWMTRYIINKLSQILIPSKFLGYNPTNVRMYIAEDQKFNHVRNSYEARVLDKELNILLRECRMADLHDKEVTDANLMIPSSIINSKSAEEMFRLEIIKRASKLNIKKNTIELFLERQNSRWLEYTMGFSYRNRYMPSLNNKGNTPLAHGVDIINKIANNEKHWIHLNELSYYQRHKAVLNEAGSMTDGMIADPLQNSIESVAWEEYYKELITSFNQTKTTQSIEDLTK